MTTETKQIENIDTFLTRLRKANMSESDIALVMRAYKFSKSAHRTQTRKNGIRRYFEHCRDLTLVLMDELNCYNPNLLCAALLHDTGEDTGMWGNITKGYEKWKHEARIDLRQCFNFDIAELVIKLTKGTVDNINFFSKEQVFDSYIQGFVENRRDWIQLETVKLNAILLKMVDRLCNLREMKDSSDSFINKQIAETETVYYPIFQLIVDDELIGQIAQQLLDLIQKQITKLKNQLEKRKEVFYFNYRYYDDRGRETQLEKKIYYFLSEDDAKTHLSYLLERGRDNVTCSKVRIKKLSQKTYETIFINNETSIIKNL